jgi:hypothetical protein
MNVSRIVPFRFLPGHAVRVGDHWTSRLNQGLRVEAGQEKGTVGTQVNYQLVRVERCGAHRCAALALEGEDVIPPQDATSGTSTFRGETTIDLADLAPIEKTIATTTKLRGDDHGTPYVYTNVVTVHLRRDDSSN